MKDQNFLMHLGDLSSYRNKFASDPINLSNSHDREDVTTKKASMRNFMKQNSIAVYDHHASAVAKQASFDSDRRLETIRSDAHEEEHHQYALVESRGGGDDTYFHSSFSDDDLVVPHLSDAHHQVDEEAIEIVNISFVHD